MSLSNEQPVGISGPAAHTFLAKARVRVRPEGDLEGFLRSSHAAARKTWPGVDLTEEQFAGYLAERLPEDEEGQPAIKVLGSMALPDLYLACACVNQVRGALEVMEREYFARLPGLLRKQFREVSVDQLDDACQYTRERLLLSTPDSAPHLLTYAGAGGLLAFIRIIAVRRVIKMLPPENEPEPADLSEAFAPGADQETDLAKREFHDKFRGVVRDVVRTALSAEERSLINEYYGKGGKQTDLARLFGTSQAGISRWLALARETIRVEAKNLMLERHGISGEELDGLMADQSRLDLTLSRLFRSGESPGST